MKKTQSLTRDYRCIVVDLNTQRDFCELEGSRPVSNTEILVPAMRRMVAWTKRNFVPVVSSVESHRKCEVPQGFAQPYCVDNSPGQKKLDFTLLGCQTRVEVDNTLSCPLDLFREFQQIIFRKRSDDLLSNPKADRFFSTVRAEEFILFGVSLEGAVKALALGLLAREKPVTIVADACGYWNMEKADLAMRQLQAKGAGFVGLEELLTRKLDRKHRYPLRTNGKAAASGNGRHTATARQNPTVHRLPRAQADTKLRKQDGRTGTKRQ